MIRVGKDLFLWVSLRRLLLVLNLKFVVTLAGGADLQQGGAQLHRQVCHQEEDRRQRPESNPGEASVGSDVRDPRVGHHFG